MRALVLGADGFVGRWLIPFAADSGDHVTAGVGAHFRPPLPSAHAIVPVDVRDAAALTQLVVRSRPDVIYYLAGVTRRGERDEVPVAAGVSVVGAVNALIGASLSDQASKLVYVSTGYVYRESPTAVTEDAQVAPVGLYAAAKLAGELALLRLGAASGVATIVARPFNHTGPGQSEAFVVPKVARQVADAMAGRRSDVEVESTTGVRDYSDVRDVVRAYRLLATDGEAGAVYNVASGRGASIEEIFRILTASASRSIELVVRRAAPADPQPSTLIGDASKLRSLGWAPAYSLEQTLADVLNQWRKSAASTGPG